MSIQLQKRYSLPQAHREIIHESCYFDHLNKASRFHFASEEDLPVIGQYLSEQFNDHWPQLIPSTLSSLISQKSLILVSDYFEICGILISKRIKLDKELVGEGRESNGKSQNVEVMFVEMVHAMKGYEKSNLIKQQLLIECFKYAHFAQKIQYIILFNNTQQIVSNLNINMKNANYLNDFVLTNSTENNLWLMDLRDLKHLLDVEPKMPLAYQVDSSLKRQVLKRFIPKRLGRELLVQIALPEDEKVFRHYMMNEFMRQTPVNKTLQLNEAESIEHFNIRIDKEQFQKGLCLMVTDQGRICAAGTCKEISDPVNERQRQAIRIPMDLKEEADKTGMSTERSRIAQAINTWMTAFVSQYLPYNVDKYMRIEMRSVHPYYIRCGIAGAITEATDQVIRDHGYQYFQTLYLAHAMTVQVEGRQIYPPAMVRFPYSEFLYNGKQIIKNGLCDGGQFVSTNLGQVRQQKQVIRDTVEIGDLREEKVLVAKL